MAWHWKLQDRGLLNQSDAMQTDECWLAFLAEQRNIGVIQIKGR